MQKIKKSIDFFTKNEIAKFAGRSKKFAMLAEATTRKKCQLRMSFFFTGLWPELPLSQYLRGEALPD